MDRSEAELLDEIVDTVALSAFDPGAWSRALDLVTRFIPESGAVLQVVNASRPELIQLIHRGYAESFASSYQTHFVHVSPWVPDMQRLRVGEPQFAEEFPSHKAMRQTEFYNDWLRPQRTREDGGALMIARGPDTIAVLSINSDHRQHARLRPKTESLLGALLGPAQQAMNVARMLPVLDLFQKNIVDLIDHPAAMLDRDLHVKVANARFEAFIRGEPAVQLCRSGLLRLRDAEAGRELERAVTRLIVDRYAPCPLPIAIRRPSSPQPLLVSLSAVPGGRPDGTIALLADLAPCYAMAVFVDPARRAPRSGEILGRVFGLSKAEIAVANALADGLALDEYAERHGLSKFTVRNQLRAVCEKTGTRRQSDVVRLVFSIGAAAKAPEASD